ncbi:MAG: nitroreductase family protein [Pirellulaceae bacterium]|nr:nitroreductase family protein [Pirellulaceae bacterium]
MAVDFFQLVRRRRSARHFTSEPVPAEVIEQALEAAIWAPNSSNVQTWDFFWAQSSESKAALIPACMNQAPARKAQHLIVVTANPKLWRRSKQPLAEWVQREKGPPPVQQYYGKIIPVTYTWGLLNCIGWLKKLGVTMIGLIRPIMRRPCLRGELEEVAIKSAALAAENFVLAITAQGYDTCMMEGFDEPRVRKILGLNRFYRVAMVIAVGRAGPKPSWGEQFRLPLEMVVHKV